MKDYVNFPKITRIMVYIAEILREYCIDNVKNVYISDMLVVYSLRSV